MARKTVKIEIPINNDDEMIKLAEAIIKKDSTDPPAAKPLAKYDMTDFDTKTTNGKASKTEARRLDKLAQAENEIAAKIIGNEPGQTVNSKGTIYNYETRMQFHFRLVPVY